MNEQWPFMEPCMCGVQRGNDSPRVPASLCPGCLVPASFYALPILALPTNPSAITLFVDGGGGLHEECGLSTTFKRSWHQAECISILPYWGSPVFGARHYN